MRNVLTQYSVIKSIYIITYDNDDDDDDDVIEMH